jgi:hypothetical protein
MSACDCGSVHARLRSNTPSWGNSPQPVLITVFLHHPSAESNVKGFAHLGIQQRQLLFFKVLRAWQGQTLPLDEKALFEQDIIDFADLLGVVPSGRVLQATSLAALVDSPTDLTILRQYLRPAVDAVRVQLRQVRERAGPGDRCVINRVPLPSLARELEGKVSEVYVHSSHQDPNLKVPGWLHDLAQELGTCGVRLWHMFRLRLPVLAIVISAMHWARAAHLHPMTAQAAVIEARSTRIWTDDELETLTKVVPFETVTWPSLPLPQWLMDLLQARFQNSAGARTALIRALAPPHVAYRKVLGWLSTQQQVERRAWLLASGAALPADIELTPNEARKYVQGQLLLGVHRGLPSGILSVCASRNQDQSTSSGDNTDRTLYGPGIGCAPDACTG